MSLQGLPRLRDPAAAVERYGWWGGTDPHLPGARRAVILMFCSLFIAGALVLGLGHYSRKTLVSGVLEPEGGAVPLVSPANAVLQRVLVRPGDSVSTGETLAELVAVRKTGLNDLPGAELGALRDSSSRLHDTLVSLEREKERLERDQAQQQQTLGRQIELTQQLEENRAHAAVLAAEDVRRLQVLVGQGLRARQDGDTAELNRLRASSDLQQVERDLAQLQGQKSQLEAQFQRDREALERQRNDIRTRIDQLDVELQQTSAELSFRIVATEAGVVDSILTGAGRAVRAGDAIVTVVRPRASLQAVLFISPAQIGFVRTGQEVLLSIDTFPMQEFGTVRGRVLEVSGTAETNSRFSTLAALKDGERSYLAVAQLSAGQVRGRGRSWPLRAGMSCRGYLALERQSLFGWLLSPVFEGLRRNPDFLKDGGS